MSELLADVTLVINWTLHSSCCMLHVSCAKSSMWVWICFQLLPCHLWCFSRACLQLLLYNWGDPGGPATKTWAQFSWGWSFTLDFFWEPVATWSSKAVCKTGTMHSGRSRLGHHSKTLTHTSLLQYMSLMHLWGLDIFFSSDIHAFSFFLKCWCFELSLSFLQLFLLVFSSISLNQLVSVFL